MYKSGTWALVTSSLTITAALILSLATAASATPQAAVTLGTAKSFAVLAGAGITNTGPTTARGSFGADFGSSPTVAFIGNATVTTTGTKYLSLDAATDSAKTDLAFAYNDAVSRTPATPITTDLGNLTLIEGVYNSPGSIIISGPLTLDGRNNPGAVFIFQAGSTLNTANSSSVILINGAQPCNVFWQVGSSSNFGISSKFVGRVLALESITAGNGAVFEGQLLARNGSVTLNTNNIINDGCAPVVTVSPSPVAPVVSQTQGAPGGSQTQGAPGGSQIPAINSPLASNPVTLPVIPTVGAPVVSVNGMEVRPQLPSVGPISSPRVPSASVAETTSGGQLPDTDAPDWQLPLALGLLLMVFGLAGYILSRRLT